MRLTIGIWSAIGAALLGCAAATAWADDAARDIERVLRKSFSGVTPDEWDARVKQDATQAACSRYRNRPRPKIAEKIAASARSHIRYPDDGVLIGDWKAGERLASIGTGGQISKLNPEARDAPRGGSTDSRP